MSDTWRLPAPTVSRERAGLLFLPGMRPMETILAGTHANAQAAEVLAGTRCTNCLTGYPERPGPETTRRIMRAAEWRWPNGADHARDLLKRGHCGVCGVEMSHAMTKAQWTGVFDPTADAKKDAEAH